MRDFDHYIALAAAMGFVVLRHAGKSWWTRAVMAGTSGGMGHAMGPEFAAVIGWLGPISAVVAVTALSYAVLDTAAALIADREAIRELVGKWAGGAK
ncbi:MAG: hypothetical protein VXY73_07240 [Pseudomonadota bacterium]|jgi:hypothetical protein|nr:hypothetical protein [Pseudomonadota bacterium]